MTDRHNIIECADQYRKLVGLPPYDGPENIVRGDGHFSKSIINDYTPATRETARDIVDIEQMEWADIRKRFMERQA